MIGRKETGESGLDHLSRNCGGTRGSVCLLLGECTVCDSDIVAVVYVYVCVCEGV